MPPPPTLPTLRGGGDIFLGQPARGHGRRNSNSIGQQAGAAVAGSLANAFSKLGDTAGNLDQRTAELPAVISEVHRLLTFANKHLPELQTGLKIAQNGAVAFAFIALAAIISTAVTGVVKATAKTTTTPSGERVDDENHQKIAYVTTAVLYSLSVVVFFGVVISSSLLWKKRKVK